MLSLVRENDQQRDAHAEQVKRMQEQIDGETHYNKRMKPVVDAAVAFEKMEGGSLPASIDRILSAVLSYQQGKQEKSCGNCDWDGKGEYPCIPCDENNSSWEPRR